jgi:hypothetical protein
MNNNWKVVTLRHSSDPKKLMILVTLPNSQMFATSDQQFTGDNKKKKCHMLCSVV